MESEAAMITAYVDDALSLRVLSYKQTSSLSVSLCARPAQGTKQPDSTPALIFMALLLP